MATIQQFLQRTLDDINGERFVKMSLGNYKGAEKELKNIYIKPVLIKRELKLSFVYRFATRDITKNHLPEEGLALIKEMLSAEGFRMAHLATVNENIIIELRKNGQWVMRTEKATTHKEASLSHDHIKDRKLSTESKPYLHELKLTDPNGKVYKNAHDKWKQINHYIEILSSALAELPERDTLRVVDMGSGKGYLTFALYDYLNNELQKPAHVQGIEYRKDMVDLCNSIASRAAMPNLSFQEGGIEDYHSTSPLDVLIALHACDTATDEAIYKGIVHDAHLIVTAPCCHKQIRREIETSKISNDLDFMTKHGIFIERHAEMLTDGIRSLLLEYSGYKTKAIQFVSDTHTPKNVMIVAIKTQVSEQKQREILDNLHSIKSYFGISYHHLERLLGI